MALPAVVEGALGHSTVVGDLDVDTAANGLDIELAYVFCETLKTAIEAIKMEEWLRRIGKI